MTTPITSVAEMQGLYGAYSFSELLLQKIWLRGDFDRDGAATVAGERVKILHPGQWNRLGGPDFKNARLRIGAATEFVGDVELHLRAEDWDAHGHARDPAYDGVRLHVVLFPPEVGRVTLGNDGKQVPVLSLLTLLQHDLEEFAADEAIERLASRPTSHVIDELSLLEPNALVARLRELAELRWRQKVHFARLRMRRLGWSEACHQTALEILGYRFNRAAMLRLAGRFPLEKWATGQVTVAAALMVESDGWSVQGVRPANHPRTRLTQYLEWMHRSPDWPTRLADVAKAWPQISIEASTKEIRRSHGFGDMRKRLAKEICGDAIGGTRLDTVIVDGLLPLLAVQLLVAEPSLFTIWFHWFPGDLPPLVPRALRDLNVVALKQQPAINGFAQGVLGWWWRRETGSALPEGRGA